MMADDGDWTAALALFGATLRDESSTDNAVESAQGTDEFELLDRRHSIDADESWDCVSCSSVSVVSTVYDHEIAHGRRYHGYKKGRYPLPNDEIEQQREEIHHATMLELADGKLFYSDIGQHPQKIIDIGTGTGIWAIDVADKYPSASVIGTDLSAIQPQWVPVNVRMFVEDCEEGEWPHGSNFDLVHYRGVAGAVQDFDSVLSTAYPHIRHGGWVEIQEVIPAIHCDDGTMAHDDPVRLLFDAATEGMRKLGCQPVNLQSMKESLEKQGFVNIQCVVKRAPISAWALDGDLRDIGVLMKTNITALIGALAAKPLAALEIAAKDRKSLATYARRSLADESIHRYLNCCFVYGQKPGSDDE